MKRPLALLFGAAVLVLAGCSGHLDAPLSPSFGLAVASMQAQIVPPQRISDQPPETAAARAAAAIRRYEQGRPKVAETQATSAVGASSLSAPAPAPAGEDR
jgi:hypothetical protein